MSSYQIHRMVEAGWTISSCPAPNRLCLIPTASAFQVSILPTIEVYIQLFLILDGENREDGEETIVGKKNLLPLLQLTVATVKVEEEIYDHVKQFLWIAVCDMVL